MSTADKSSDDEKVPEDIARAFDEAIDDTDEPDTLRLDEANSEVLRREMDGKPVARVYDCDTYGSRAYYAVRDENRHFFFKKKGYPIDDSILQDLKAADLEKVFIGLKRSKSVLEFDLEQYTRKEQFDEGWGVQRCAPKDEARRVWPNAVGSILDDE